MVQLIVADFFDFTFWVVVASAIRNCHINCLDEQAVIHIRTPNLIGGKPVLLHRP